jgi:hypothetical protein
MSTTSSSRRKRRITGWSRPGALATLSGLLLLSCSGGRETFVTYFNGDHGLSLRHPASWRTDQAEQEGVWYRYFLAPPSGAQSRSPVSVTLLAGPATGTLDEYAERYIADRAVATTKAEERQGAAGKSWVYATADGATRYRLLLLRVGERVIGLYAQGDAAGFEKQVAAIDEMWSSLTLERPERYPRVDFKLQKASLGIPETWRETRRFSGGGTLLVQYVSPPLGADKDHGTVHASLSLTFEASPEPGGLEPYYWATRKKLGDNFQVVNHSSFKGGYVDVMKIETPMAVSYIKRYYFADGPRGCSLSFEGREDVFPRASRWADYIASTLRFGAAPAPEAAAP